MIPLRHPMTVACSCCGAVYQYGNVGRSRHVALDHTAHDGTVTRHKPAPGSPCCRATLNPKVRS